MLELQLRGPLIGYAQSTVHSLWATRPAYSASTYLGCLVGGIRVYIEDYSPVEMKYRHQEIQSILCCALYHYSIQVIPTIDVLNFLFRISQSYRAKLCCLSWPEKARALTARKRYLFSPGSLLPVSHRWWRC